MGLIGVADAELDDRSVARLWAESGAAWLTDPDVAVPGTLVRRVVGLVERLDARGARAGALVPARGVGLLAERAAAMGLARGGRTSAGGATRLMRGADGWLAVSLARDDDRALVPAWLECVVDDEAGWVGVESAVSTRPVHDLVSRAVLLGLPCAAVDEVTAAAVTGGPVRADRVADSPSRSVEGAVVLDLASLWAGPLAADVLSRLGARVITVESTRRPDGGRLAGRFFDALHGRSESVGLDLTTEAGRSSLRALIRAADVVIEGSRPRALEQMGVDARQAVRSGPAVWVSITAHGRGDVERDRVGFGDDAAASGGLVGWVDDEPRFLADAVADPLTGLTAAAATCELLESGGRWMVDVALSRVARSAVGGWVPTSDDPIVRPVRRRDPGAAMPLGRDTAAVLSELRL